MKHETLRTLAQYVDVTTQFVGSLTEQGVAYDRAGEEPDRVALAAAVSALRVAQRRLGAALGQLCEYEDTLG